MYSFFEGLFTILIILIVAAALFFGLMSIDRATCFAKTENIGFDNRWSMFGGCQIEVETGQWIPLDSYYFKQE